MASHFQIQKPYVLTALPRPFDPATGRYVVGDVYGSLPGSRKRKRTELTVGIDGDAVNIYDISSARLVTSYPIPPQTRFSCAPTSIRRKESPGAKGFARYTYVALEEDSARPKVTLFKDVVDASGDTVSTTQTFVLGPGEAVVHLGSVNSLLPPRSSEAVTSRDDLVVVRADGEAYGLDAETLQRKWTSSLATLSRGAIGTYSSDTASSKPNFHIEYCCVASVHEVTRGIFNGSNDLISSFPGELASENSDSEVVVFVSTSGTTRRTDKTLHIAGLLPPQEQPQGAQGLALLYACPIPPVAKEEERTLPSTYRLDVRSGSLLQLRAETLAVYDLKSSLARISTTMKLDGATSFLRLSSTSILSSTDMRLDICNPIYKSLQSSMPMELENQSQAQRDLDIKSSKSQLVAYFSRLELSIAIVDCNLVAIQLEAPKLRSKKRRAEGLLIDSIGRGLSLPARKHETASAQTPKGGSAFGNYLPGSFRGKYWETWLAEEAKADAFVESNDFDGLERLLADKFGVKTTIVDDGDGAKKDGEQPAGSLCWQLPQTRTGYPFADRRWVLYAIRRVFQWADEENLVDAQAPRLTCQLPKSNLLSYLVDAGHLTLSNVKSAFHLGNHKDDRADWLLAEQLVLRLAEADQDLELISIYIAATTLGSVELLLAVRTIMRSLELVQDPRRPPPKLLADGSTEEPAEEAEDGTIGMELDSLESEIQKTETHLTRDIRSQGLSAAFTKLGKCPGPATIRALQHIYKPEEILSLVYLLRIELVRGQWTSRYLDDDDYSAAGGAARPSGGSDSPPDGVIKLIGDLLGRCVDSLGLGGWLLNDAVLGGDDGDFVASLKLEVSAALEGLEEAVYLRGVVGEAVKYCQAAEKQQQGGRHHSQQQQQQQQQEPKLVDTSKPILLRVKEPGDELLPLGLKTKTKLVTGTKLRSGGEIIDRTVRETGHLVSQQVGAYSLERIAI